MSLRGLRTMLLAGSRWKISEQFLYKKQLVADYKAFKKFKMHISYIIHVPINRIEELKVEMAEYCKRCLNCKGKS